MTALSRRAHKDVGDRIVLYINSQMISWDSTSFVSACFCWCPRWYSCSFPRFCRCAATILQDGWIRCQVQFMWCNIWRDMSSLFTQPLCMKSGSDAGFPLPSMWLTGRYRSVFLRGSRPLCCHLKTLSHSQCSHFINIYCNLLVF